ncbi:shikimate 5-dehydrogenase, partial [Klebsiella pneumoniae]
MINRDTLLCISLAGRPGNFGTRFHNYLYDKLGLNYLYKAFTTKDIEAAVKGVRALGIRGCAVSMPFKESCIPFLDAIDPSAKVIDSVNTIVNDDGKLTGLNTDYIAVKSLIASHRLDTNARVMIQGSGGMGKAVIAAFRDAGFRDVIIAARNRQRGLALAKQYGFQWQPLPEGIAAEILVNVTPLGMAGGA